MQLRMNTRGEVFFSLFYPFIILFYFFVLFPTYLSTYALKLVVSAPFLSLGTQRGSNPDSQIHIQRPFLKWLSKNLKPVITEHLGQ